LASSIWVKASGLSPEQLSVGTAITSSQFEARAIIQGILASGYVPVIKGIMTVFLVASIPIVVILLMVGDVFIPRRIILTGLFTVMFWLSLWHFAEAILNMIVAVKTGNLLQSIYGGGNYIPLQSSPVISNEVVRYVSMASNYYWAIPFLTLLFSGGFSIYTMNALAGKGTAAVAASSAGAGDVVLGNIRVGNISENTVNSNTTVLNSMSRDVWTFNTVSENITTRNVIRGDDGSGNKVDLVPLGGSFYSGNIQAKEGTEFLRKSETPIFPKMLPFTLTGLKL